MKPLVFSMLTLLGATVISQNTFEGAIMGGLNMAQIGGDYLAGYNKPGFHGGGRVSVQLPGRSSRVAVEFLYSERGARSTRRESLEPLAIRLQYIEIPVLFQLNDWESKTQKHNWYKASAFAGLSVGNLFRSSVTPGTVQPIAEVQDEFTRRDLSVVAGALLRPSYHWGINARFTRSLTALYNPKKHNLGNQDPQVRYLFGYFVSFGLMYYF